VRMEVDGTDSGLFPVFGICDAEISGYSTGELVI
jgi:hypothetical protein